MGQYLTRDQARYVYKKVETGEMINTDMIKQEIEQEKQLNRMDDRNGEINPYRELVVNNTEKTEPPMTQMEQWSILSNVLNYVQHNKFISMNHTLNVRPVNRYKVKPDMGKEFRELDFGTVPQNLQEEYLDMYEGIQSDIVSSNRFDENSDIGTTHLGKIESKESQDELKAEESFPISENGYTLGRLWDGTNVSYYWTQALVNPSCQNHFICDVNHYTPYQSLLPLCREYRLGMVSVLVYYL